MTTNIKCASCEVACDSDIITCEICGLYAIHIQCLGNDPFHISVGKMSWKCDNCANVSIASLLSTILPKLDALSSDMSMVKNSITEMKQSNAPQRPSYLDALSKGVPKMNPFLDRRERLDSAASNRSERKKRKLKNQQENEATDFTVDLTETEDEDMRPKNDARTSRKKVVNVNVVKGSQTGSTSFTGVELKPRGAPRRHYFVSRVSTNITKESLHEYCQQKEMDPIACRELPSMRQNVKSFHLVIPEAKMDIAESSDTWPEHVILRRYFLNDEARSWLKTVNETSQQ